MGSRLLRRLSYLWRQRQMDVDLGEELEFHRELKQKELERTGMSSADAANASKRVLGNVMLARENAREIWITRWLDDLWRDIAYAVRSLRRNPGFAIVVVLTLALGIGANTTIFSVINALLLRPLPVERPNELVSLYTSDFSGPAYGASSFPDYLDFKAQRRVIRDLAAQAPQPAAFVLPERTERAQGMLVTGNYFGLLGVRPALGRVLERADDEPAAELVVVLSNRFWQRLGGSASIVGQAVTINGQPFTVVGVGPPSFAGVLPGFDSDLWIASAALPRLRPGSNALTSRTSRGWMLTGRLAVGASVDQTRAAFDVVARQQLAQYREAWLDVQQQGRRVSVVPTGRVGPNMRGTVAGFMALLMTCVGLVLLIACANVANLLLSRAARRTREVAIRLALGAGRRQLIRQLLTESLVLSMVAGAAGILLAFWSARAIAAFNPPVPLPVPLDPSLDPRVLLFALGISIVTGIAFGLVPALHATRPVLVPSLKTETAWTATRRRLGAGQALVVGQVALSLLLLVAAGLFIRTLQQSQRIHLGFDPDRVVVTSIDLIGIQPTPERAGFFYRALLERLSQIPEAERVSLAAFVPLGMSAARRGITVEGYEFRDGEDPEFHLNVVTPGYLETMRIPIVRGRAFTSADREGAPPVAIVNEAFARRFWPHQEPLGKRIKPYGAKGPWAEVVGVTEDGHYVNLLDETLPYFFLPLEQGMRPTMTVHVRTGGGDPSLMIPAVRTAVREINSNVSVFDGGLLDQRIGVGLLPMRVAASALGVFGAVALMLAAIGLYGVLAYSVAQRTREIGIRMALGARPAAVIKLVLGETAALTATGIVLGLGGAAAVTRYLRGMLFGVTPLDLATFVVVTVMFSAVATLAAFVPARRATKIDPMVALRCE